jgi:hypothetical protein
MADSVEPATPHEGVVMNTRKKVKGAAHRLAIAADAALVKAGQAAEHRQRSRALKETLKSAAKFAAVAATTAAVVGARAAARARRRREPPVGGVT